MKKQWTTISLLLIAILSISGCAAAQTPDASATETPGLVLTLEELKQYNGKDGQPAYVAVDGVIYDFSGLAAWKDGEHNGYSASNDLTEAIKTKSPHGVSKLKGVPVVGKLAQE